MSRVTVNSEDLLALVRACQEYELDARAHRATWNTLRLTVNKPQLDLRYAEVYRSERDKYAKTAERKYEPMSQAIADGTPTVLLSGIRSNPAFCPPVEISTIE